ncbi:hypothetical protein Pelo_18685 [Pelomyxa schiedti]|nr:hypothetical protein Pelo_18685 [Pelomyxa schiedti]
MTAVNNVRSTAIVVNIGSSTVAVCNGERGLWVFKSVGQFEFQREEKVQTSGQAIPKQSHHCVKGGRCL